VPVLSEVACGQGTRQALQIVQVKKERGRMYDREYELMRQENQLLASEREEMSNHRLLAETFGDGDEEDDQYYSDEPRDDTYDEQVEDDENDDELDDLAGEGSWPSPSTVPPTVPATTVHVSEVAEYKPSPDDEVALSKPGLIAGMETSATGRNSITPPPAAAAKRSTAKKKSRAADHKSKLGARKAKKKGAARGATKSKAKVKR
jgi:hypothetical protein